MKKLESLYKQNVSKMETALELKLENASSSLEEQNNQRLRRISELI